MRRILVVDDEPDLCEILCFNLQREGFVADRAYSAEQALQMIREGDRFDLLLLDVMLEQMSGFEMAHCLRQGGDNTPIIFLTARDTENDLLEGFAYGGDDYVTKPFSFPTVLARINAVLKRSVDGNHNVIGTMLSHNNIAVDPKRRTVTVAGTPVQLTPKEFSILTLLMSHPGECYSREQILSEAWEEDIYVTDRSVDVHIARLRKKLGEAGNAIVNRTGFGYLFRLE